MLNLYSSKSDADQNNPLSSLNRLTAFIAQDQMQHLNFMQGQNRSRHVVGCIEEQQALSCLP